MPNSLARVGAFVALLLALRSFWPPVVSWWPPFHLFWPLILVAGALLILWPSRLPVGLQKVASHRDFGAIFTALVGAHFWVYGGIFWLVAAIPLALTFWRGAAWNWDLRAQWHGSHRVFLVGVALALVALRLPWTQYTINTGSYFLGGMNYGLNTYNPSTGYYEWGFQYNALQNVMPGFSSQYDVAGVALRGGLWATLGCALLLLALVRGELNARALRFAVGILGAWWLWSLLSGNVTRPAGWLFPLALAALFYGLRDKWAVRS